MTAAQSMKLYQIAQRYFNNPDDASAFVTEIENVVDNKIDKSETVRQKLLNKDLENLRLELKESIANSKSDMIKWFVAFFITLALMIVGLYLKK